MNNQSQTAAVIYEFYCLDKSGNYSKKKQKFADALVALAYAKSILKTESIITEVKFRERGERYFTLVKR